MQSVKEGHTLTSELGHSEMKWAAEVVEWSILLCLRLLTLLKQAVFHCCNSQDNSTYYVDAVRYSTAIAYIRYAHRIV